MERVINVKILATFAVLVLLGTFTITSCSGGSSESKAPDGCGGKMLKAVVSVGQWSSMVKQAVGKCGEVTSIVKDTSVDPHDFEPTPNDLLGLENADLVVVNGAGYDEWASKALDTSKNKEGQVIDISKYAPTSSTKDNNPHYWYNPTVISVFAVQLHQALLALSNNAPAFDENFKVLENQISQLQTSINIKNAEIATSKKDHNFASTESVADYLFEALGLNNVTPEGYENAVSNESEPTAVDLEQFKQKLINKQVQYLSYNKQEANETTREICKNALENDVKVIEVMEQLPNDYLDKGLFEYLNHIISQV